MRTTLAVGAVAVIAAAALLVACDDTTACAAPPAPRPPAPVRVPSVPRQPVVKQPMKAPTVYRTEYRNGVPVIIPIVVDSDCD